MDDEAKITAALQESLKQERRLLEEMLRGELRVLVRESIAEEMAEVNAMLDDRVRAGRGWMPATLSIVVTVAYLGILIGIMSGVLKVSDSQALLLMLGSLSTAWGLVMALWLTIGHGRKTEPLAHAGQ